MKSIWSLFKECFNAIIKSHQYYQKIFLFLQTYEQNVLLYGTPGFPTDLFINETLKHKYNLPFLHKTECVWNKEFIYHHNPYFLELDLMHPSMSKVLSTLPAFLTDIIKNKSINAQKHLIIIKHIDLLSVDDFISFRIILERYSQNVFFICTTHHLGKIDQAVRSRFALVRMPLFTAEEIEDIFKAHLKIPINNLIDYRNRNIIKTIFIAEVELNEPHIVNQDFCKYHFPPIVEFINKYKAKNINIEDIRLFANKCFQYNISLSALTTDLITFFPKKKSMKIIECAADIDHMLKTTTKGREPFYIESFLCQVLL